ncbi:MAG: ribosomal protein L36, partial [Marteilia pararefringens]
AYIAKSVVLDVCGLSPYKQHAVGLLKSKKKRCGKFLRKRLGNYRRAQTQMRLLEKLVMDGKVHA